MNNMSMGDGKGKKKEVKRPRGELKSATTLNPDRLFGKLSGVVPVSEQSAFTEWLGKHPRAMEGLKKGIISTGELNSAYQQYVKETRGGEEKKNALATVNPEQIAAMISVPQEKVEKLLELYNPEYLKSLAVLSQRCESDFETVVTVDEALLHDGSYIDRPEETKEVVLACEAIEKMVNSGLQDAAKLKAKRQHDVPLDNLWEKLMEEHEGDEKKAAEAYAKEAEERLTGATGESFKPVKIDRQMMVEIFKLFNYSQDDLDKFVEYASVHLEVASADNVEDILGKVLKEFIDVTDGVVLNERSIFYSRRGEAGESGRQETERAEAEIDEKEVDEKDPEPNIEPLEEDDED